MKKLLIAILLALSSNIFAVTLTTYNNVNDFNSQPIPNHWVYLSAFDSTYAYTYIDSTLTDSSGAYYFNVNNIPSTQIYFNIYTFDCQNNIHDKYVSPANPTTTPFVICSNQPPPNCSASFTVNQDSINPLSYTFTNTSTNNFTNEWYINNNIVSTQTNLTYVFPNTQSSNNVCLIIENATQNCSDTSCTSIVINNCNTSFIDSINGNTVIFTAIGNPQADYYYWDFGDGSTQNTNNAVITHSYNSSGTYTVNLTAYSFSPTTNDTCVSYANGIVNISQQSNMGTIYGYVFVDSLYLDAGTVELYQKDAISQKMIFVNSSQIMLDSSAAYSYFIFNNIPYGDYYLKTNISTTSIFYNRYFNTWASQNINDQITQWNLAQAQTLNSSSIVTMINLKKPDISFNSGQGRISGTLTNTMGINTIATTIYLLNQDKLLVGGIEMDSTNEFTFDSLIYGTYYLKPELTNINSMEYEVIISSNIPFADSLQINVDSNNFFVGQNNPKWEEVRFDVFPNPFNSEINIDINSAISHRAVISIYDILGNIIYSKGYQIGTNSSIKIPLKEINSGMYIIRISDDYGISTKKIIKR